ncbi:helix-turn-helix transcriptional regulator [Glaciibacter superstes]|uniref:helix-turn-helix transcriptional regulator n=1 Tax=Glaciibacter superstes TaxID=501023 RepID=UPI000523FEA4|nr:AAA family ATPase [Glaciibacter superstes]
MTSSVSSPAMIGRENDLVNLRAALADSLTGVPRGIVIAGEAGIGKTRLLDEFRKEATDRVLPLVGQCVDLGTVGAPYAPIMNVLRDLIAARGVAAVLDAAGPGQEALAALLPELRTTTGEMRQPELGINRIHEVVAVLLEKFSRETPLLVIIEDLHWADGATRNLLRFLLKVLVSGRILILLSYRSDDVPRGHPLRGFLSELERGRRIDRWELRRLSRSQVRKQAKAILGWAPDAIALESVFERSEGVPFFVEELLGLDDSGDSSSLPQTLSELLLARYERLSEPTQHLLRLISAGGVRVKHDLLSSVFDGEPGALDDGAREAVQANVLVADENSYAFRHALVREAIHADLLPGERTRFHTRFAEALEATSGERPVAAWTSYHWSEAHDVAKAFPASLDAMVEAKRSYAYSTAAQMGERALGLWDAVTDAEAIAGRPKTDLLGQTASALRNAGEGERSLAMVNVALDECPREDWARYARLLRDKAFYLAYSGVPGSDEILTEALDLVPEGAAGELRATIIIGLAGRYMLEARLDEAVELANTGFAEAQRAGSSAQSSVASNIMGVSKVQIGRIDEGLADLERARILAGDNRTALLRYRVNASDVLYLLGRFEEAMELAKQGLDRARELGVERSSGVILASNAVDPLFDLGDWDRADALIKRSLDLDPPIAFTQYLQRARMRSTLWRGNVDAAAEQYRSQRSAMSRLAGMEEQSSLGVARVAGEIALAQNDPVTAWERVSVVIAQGRRPLPAYDLSLIAVAGRVVAARRATSLRSGADSEFDADSAEAQLRTLLERESFWPTFSVLKALFEAEVGGDSGLGTDVDAWNSAVQATGDARVPAHLFPYALARLGEAQVAAGDKVSAQESLVHAAGRAAELGAGLIIASVRDVAARAGIVLDGDAPSRRKPSDSPELTARERQVLELLGQGLSNRQIGERLFISAKTASVHVSAILRKLGASSRTEAVFLARSPV